MGKINQAEDITRLNPQLSPRLNPRDVGPRNLPPGRLGDTYALLAEREAALAADPRLPVFSRPQLRNEQLFWPVGTRSATSVKENHLGDQVEVRSFTDAFGDKVTTRSVMDKYGDEVRTTSILDPCGERVQTKVDTSNRLEAPLKREVDLRTLATNKSVDDLWMSRFRTRTYQERLDKSIYGLTRPVFRDDPLLRRSGRALGF